MLFLQEIMFVSDYLLWGKWWNAWEKESWLFTHIKSFLNNFVQKVPSGRYFCTLYKGYYTATHRGGDEWTTHHRCWTPPPLITCDAITRALRKGISPDDAFFPSINRITFAWKSHVSCRKSLAECNQFFPTVHTMRQCSVVFHGME